MRRTGRGRAPRGSRSIVAAAFVGALTTPFVAAAEQAPRLTAPDGAAVQAAGGILARGRTVVVVESGPGHELSQVTLLARLPASREAVYELLADPESYEAIPAGMTKVEARTRAGRSMTYDWRYGGGLFGINGTSAMALAPPAAVQHQTVQGGYGPGGQLFRITEDGPSRSVLAVATHYDVSRSRNFLVRWLARRSPDFLQAWNIGHAVMTLTGIEAALTERAGTQAAPRPSVEVASGPLDLAFSGAEAQALGPLLERGRVIVIERDRRGRVGQASVVERVESSEADLRTAIAEVGSWPDFMGVVDVQDLARNGGGQSFELVFSFPAFSVSTDVAMVERPDGFDVSSPTGSLRGSLISFRHRGEGGAAVLTTTGRLALQRGGRILRRMLSEDPSLAHAMNASFLAGMSQALAARAEGRR